MKIVKVEFSFFSSLNWAHTNVEIIDKDLESLEESIGQLFDEHGYLETQNGRTCESKIRQVLKRAKVKNLTFPIIHTEELK